MSTTSVTQNKKKFELLDKTFNRIGQLKYGDKWIKNEPVTALYPSSYKADKRSRYHIVRDFLTNLIKREIITMRVKIKEGVYQVYDKSTMYLVLRKMDFENSACPDWDGIWYPCEIDHSNIPEAMGKYGTSINNFNTNNIQ